MFIVWPKFLEMVTHNLNSGLHFVAVAIAGIMCPLKGAMQTQHKLGAFGRLPR